MKFNSTTNLSPHEWESRTCSATTRNGLAFGEVQKKAASNPYFREAVALYNKEKRYKPSDLFNEDNADLPNSYTFPAFDTWEGKKIKSEGLSLRLLREGCAYDDAIKTPGAATGMIGGMTQSYLAEAKEDKRRGCKKIALAFGIAAVVGVVAVSALSAGLPVVLGMAVGLFALGSVAIAADGIGDIGEFRACRQATPEKALKQRTIKSQQKLTQEAELSAIHLAETGHLPKKSDSLRAIYGDTPHDAGYRKEEQRRQEDSVRKDSDTVPLLFR